MQNAFLGTLRNVWFTAFHLYKLFSKQIVVTKE